jgi:hypothetical protein
MKILISFAILASLATASYADANPELITIKGLNVDSSPEQIANILGECRQNPEHTNNFLCGGDENSLMGYSVNDDGDASHITL